MLNFIYAHIVDLPNAGLPEGGGKNWTSTALSPVHCDLPRYLVARAFLKLAVDVGHTSRFLAYCLTFSPALLRPLTTMGIDAIDAFDAY